MSMILRIGRNGTKLARTWQGQFGIRDKLLLQARDVTGECPRESRNVRGEVYLTCDEETSRCSLSQIDCIDDLGCPEGESCERGFTPGSNGFFYSHLDAGGPFQFTNTGGSGQIVFDYDIALAACLNPPPGGSDEPEEGDFVRAAIGIQMIHVASGNRVSVPIVTATGMFSPEDQSANPGFDTINGQAIVRTGDTAPHISGFASGRLAFTDQGGPGGEWWRVGCRYRFTWTVQLISLKADQSPANYALYGVNFAPQKFSFTAGPGCLRPIEPFLLP